MRKARLLAILTQIFVLSYLIVLGVVHCYETYFDGIIVPGLPDEA